MLTKKQAIAKVEEFLENNNVTQMIIEHGVTVYNNYNFGDYVCLRLDIEDGDIYMTDSKIGDRTNNTINLIMVQEINLNNCEIADLIESDIYDWIQNIVENYNWRRAIDEYYDYYVEYE